MNKYERYENDELVEVIPFTENELTAISNKVISKQIEELEKMQTPRRIREALSDPAWMNNLDAQIKNLRNSFK